MNSLAVFCIFYYNSTLVMVQIENIITFCSYICMSSANSRSTESLLSLDCGVWKLHNRTDIFLRRVSSVFWSQGQKKTEAFHSVNCSFLGALSGSTVNQPKAVIASEVCHVVFTINISMHRTVMRLDRNIDKYTEGESVQVHWRRKRTSKIDMWRMSINGIFSKVAQCYVFKKL
jgi:hypothetical protein